MALLFEVNQQVRSDRWSVHQLDILLGILAAIYLTSVAMILFALIFITVDHYKTEKKAHTMKLIDGAPLLKELGLDFPTPEGVPPGYVKCACCPAVIPEARAKFGSLSPRLRKTLSIEGPFEKNGVETYNEVIKHRPDNAWVCPEHAHKLVPLEDSHGNVIASGQKWPETE